MRSFIFNSVLIGVVFSFSSITAHAGTKDKSRHEATPELDIRSVEDSSVDVFDVLAHIPKADTAFAQGDYTLALQHYRYVYLHDPKQTHSAMGYADSALALGQTALAAQIYEGFKTDVPRAQNGWLLTRIIQKTIDNPEIQLRDHLKLSPNDARLWNMLGQLFDKDNRGHEARQAYASAQRSGQRAGLAANNIGQSFLIEGRLDDAYAEFTQANLAAPRNRLFDNNRRLTLLLKKDYTKALSQLDKDRSSQLLKDAGLIVARQGEKKLAVYFLEKSIALNPVYDGQTAQYLAQLSQ